MRLRFFVINMSPFEVRITSIKFNFSAVMDAFKLSGEYNGPPGENIDSVVRLAPWQQHHFFVRVKGTLANMAKIPGTTLESPTCTFTTTATSP